MELTGFGGWTSDALAKIPILFETVAKALVKGGGAMPFVTSQGFQAVSADHLREQETDGVDLLVKVLGTQVFVASFDAP